jgi:hypothetical protein
VDEVLDNYFAAWSEPNLEQRRRALERAVITDVELVDPTGRWQGVAGLPDRTSPAGRSLTLTVTIVRQMRGFRAAGIHFAPPIARGR